jgi:prepilin-type N-terminal cleavage/methylation domain-containing protein
MSRRGAEDGFTLIELLVAMTLGLIVSFAILQSSDLFFKHAGEQTRVLDGNDQVRTIMDQTVRDLQGASTILTAGSQDLIYTIQQPTGLQTKRLCVSGGRLYGMASTAPTAPPTTATPCTSGYRYATLKAAAPTGFTYDGAASSATPSTVHNVGLTFALDTTSPKRVSSTLLTASASRRLGTLPLDPAADLPVKKCDKNGALLGIDPLGALGPVTVRFTDLGGTAVGTSVSGGVQIPPGITSVIATVTNAAGVTSSVQKDVDCG